MCAKLVFEVDPTQTDTQTPPEVVLPAGPARAHLEALIPTVYDELRELARGYMRRERSDHTLQPTALVHEAFQRLMDQRRTEWEGRSHFMAIAAISMRRLLLQHAERTRAAKRGGGRRERLSLDAGDAMPNPFEIDIESLIDLNQCLARLAECEPRHAALVELRVFAGLTLRECAEHLGRSLRTTEREWRLASAWLRRELAKPTPP